MTRKQFLKWSGLGLIAALSAPSVSNASGFIPIAPIGTPNNPRRGPEAKLNKIRDITLRISGTGAAQILELRNKAQADLGFRINLWALSTEENNVLAITQPERFDVFDGEYFSLPLVVPSGNLQGIDVRRIRNFDKIVPIFTQGELYRGAKVNTAQGITPFSVTYLESRNATTFANRPTNWATVIPFQSGIDSLGYRSDLVNARITSWGDLLSRPFAGKTSIVNVPAIGIADAAIAVEALGLMTFRDKGNMTREEIDRLIAILGDYKREGHFYSFWRTFDESVLQMLSGNVVLQSIWQPAVFALRLRGVPCIQASLREGYRGWAGGLALSANLSGMMLDAAYDYLNWTLDGWVGAWLSRNGYYCATPDTAKRFMSQSEWGYWYEGRPATEDIYDPFGHRLATRGERRDGGAFMSRAGDIVLWNSVMQEQVYLNRRWNELTAN